MRYAHQSIPLMLVGILACLTAGQGNLTTLADLWPTMEDLQPVPRQKNLPLGSGGVDFGKCCLLALNESVQIVNHSLAFVPGQTFLHGDINVFASNPLDPCAADYTGYEASVPQGTITYSWCQTHCGGWSEVPVKIYGAWVLPFITFILPAIVFSINIPRRYQFHIPRSWFPNFKFPECLNLVWTAPLGGLSAALEILVWMTTVLIAAGPMLMSGMQESMIDRRIVRLLRSKHSETSHTLKERARLALILLLGHLDLEQTWDDSDTVLEILPDDSVNQSPAQKSERTSTVVMVFKTLLSAQPEFGPVLGVGLVFFLGAFVYSDIEIQQAKGNSVQAHSLALGIFWMVIPHTAIIATSLLAGSNTAAWYAVVKSMKMPGTQQTQALPSTPPSNPSSQSQQAAQQSSGQGQRRRRVARFKAKANAQWKKLKHISVRVFVVAKAVTVECFENDPKYLPKQQWMWNRGPCKAAWVRKFASEYPKITDATQSVLRFGLLEWLLALLLPTTLMIFIPAFLGAMISYTTPVVGLSCKSLGPAIYACSQFVLCVLWMIENRVPGLERKTKTPLFVTVLWVLLIFICAMASFASSIILGALSFSGVLNSCLCYYPIKYWPNRLTIDRPIIFLGGDTLQRGRNAGLYWLPAGIGGAVFLLTMCFIGWWHQKRLRGDFNYIVDTFEKPPTTTTLTHATSTSSTATTAVNGSSTSSAQQP